MLQNIKHYKFGLELALLVFLFIKIKMNNGPAISIPVVPSTPSINILGVLCYYRNESIDVCFSFKY